MMNSLLLALTLILLSPVELSLGDEPVIEIIAGEDGFKVPGRKKPEITVKANSVVRLRIMTEAEDGREKDQALHSFTIKSLISQGWHLILKAGTQEFTLTTPSQPGKYRVECLVFCGEIHQDMSMTMTVVLGDNYDK